MRSLAPHQQRRWRLPPGEDAYKRTNDRPGAALYACALALIAAALISFGHSLLPADTDNTADLDNADTGTNPGANEAAVAAADGGSAEKDVPAQSREPLSLSVPKMERVSDSPLRTAPADDSGALRSGPVRMQGSGLPHQERSNVYISGHRLGYPNTDSFMLFSDLHELEDGDRVLLEDAAGKDYAYRVFERRTYAPSDTSASRAPEDKNIVSLQTCTLPDYRERLVITAELVDGPADQQRA